MEVIGGDFPAWPGFVGPRRFFCRPPVCADNVRALHLLFFVLTLALAAPAGPPVEVVHRGDPDCGLEFDRSLASFLAGSSGGRPVRATLRLTHGRGRWSAELALEVAGGRSTRRLHGASCPEIARAAAFVTAVVVDPGVVDRSGVGDGAAPVTDSGAPHIADAPMVPDAPGRLASTPDASVVPEQAPAGANPSVTARQSPAAPGSAASPAGTGPPDVENDPARSLPAARRRARPGGFARLVGGVEALGMPSVGAQAAVAAGVRGRVWRVELVGMYRAPTTVASAVDPGVGARVQLWTIGARGCGVLRPAAVLEVPLCAGVEVGQAIGEGLRYEGARRDAIAWAAVTVGPALGWLLRPRLVLWAGLDVAIPVVRGGFSATGLGTLFTIAPVSPRAVLGIELRFL